MRNPDPLTLQTHSVANSIVYTSSRRRDQALPAGFWKSGSGGLQEGLPGSGLGCMSHHGGKKLDLGRELTQRHELLVPPK